MLIKIEVIDEDEGTAVESEMRIKSAYAEREKLDLLSRVIGHGDMNIAAVLLRLCLVGVDVTLKEYAAKQCKARMKELKEYLG